MVGPAPGATAPSPFQPFDDRTSGAPPRNGPFGKNPVGELPPVPVLQSRNGPQPSTPPSKPTAPQAVPASGNASGDKPESAQWKIGLTRTFHDRSGGGTTDFRETVVDIRREGDLLIGTIKREVLLPNKGTGEMEVIGSHEVEVRFDTARDRIILKQGFNFERADSSGTEGICAVPSAEKQVDPVSDNRFARIKSDYLRWGTEGLSDQFKVRIDGGEPIPITIEVGESTDPSAKPVRVVNRAGRGDSATICAKEFDRGFAAHEFGHNVPGVGDEYRENDQRVREQEPKFAHDERVRTDVSMMGNHALFGKLAVFQERHFRHVQVFLEAAFPGKKVELIEVPHRTPDFRILYGAGYANLSGEGGLQGHVGFDIGVPLTRGRELSFLVGAHSSYLTNFDKSALTAGIRFGLERRSFSSWGSIAVDGGIEAGGLHAFESYRGSPARTSGYVSGTAGVELTLGVVPGGIFGLDFSVGREASGDPDALHWFTMGGRLGFRF
jgi:hypothetical protein